MLQEQLNTPPWQLYLSLAHYPWILENPHKLCLKMKKKKKNQKLKNLDNSCSFATSALSSRKTHTEKMKQTNTSLPQIVAEC